MITSTSPQTIPTRQQVPLDAEDFRRLGVRPNEYRLGIIRSAATRSARPLADRQLTRPNEKTIRQLSKVVASAYRLMDPRRRQSSAQRAYVGRILPQTLRVAGRTKFAPKHQSLGHQSLGHQGLGDQQLLSERQQTALVTEIHLKEGSNRSETISKNFVWNFALGNRETIPEDQLWQATLRDEDLVSMTKTSRKIRHVQRGIRKRWIAIVGTGLVVGALLGLLTMRHNDSPNLKVNSPAITPASPSVNSLIEGHRRSRSSEREPAPSGQLTKTPYLLDPFEVEDGSLTKPSDDEDVSLMTPLVPETSPTSVSLIETTETGFRGRLSVATESQDATIAFEDMGVSMRYQQGIPVTPQMLVAMEKQLRRPLAGVTMSLRGVFEHQMAQRFSFLLVQGLEEIHQQLVIDGKPVELASQSVLLSTGMHEIEWQVMFLDDFSLDHFVGPIQLSLGSAPASDPANWQPVDVFSLASDRDMEQPSDLKVAIIAPE